MENNESAKTFFDKFAKTHHSQVPLEDFWKDYTEKHVFESLTKFNDFSKFNRILEIGCGTGHYLSGYSSFRNKPFVVGVDISLESLKKCNANFRDFSFILCDGSYLPFEPQTFDGVLMINLLHHVPNYKSTLEESTKVIKYGGYELIIDLTSTNLLINFARKIWFLLPHSFMDKIGDLQLERKIPEKYPISQKNLIRSSEELGVEIMRMENLHLFVFIFYYLLQLIPQMSLFFNEKMLSKTLALEKKLLTSLFGNFGHIIILFMRKKS
jgi:ubiquinone/menaquinone biosynthesis C-methylase UbiE